MSKFKYFTYLVVLTASFSYAQILHKDLEDKNILVVYGGWEGHKPKLFAEKIVSWLREKKQMFTFLILLLYMIIPSL